jgi:hypothetical protein
MKIGVSNLGVLGDVLNTAVLPCNKQEYLENS